MNRSFALALTGLLFSAPVLSPASEITPEEKTFFDQQTSQMVRFETERLDDLALDKCFAVPFYKVKVVLQISDNQPMTTLTLARVDDKLVSMEKPGTDTELPDFLKMLSPDFKLRNDADARAMHQALNKLFPPFMSSEEKLLGFKRAGNNWHFIRGEFFESKSGYVFETGPGGAIKAVKYQLRLP